MLENFYNLSLTHNRNYFVRKILSVRVFLNFLKDAPFGAKNKHFPLLSHPLGFLKLRGKNVPWIVFTRKLRYMYGNVERNLINQIEIVDATARRKNTEYKGHISINLLLELI